MEAAFRRHHKSSASAAPVVMSKNHEHRSVAAVRGAWDDDLDAAITAASSKNVLMRKATSNADWEDALSAAITENLLRQKRPGCTTEGTTEPWMSALNEALPQYATRASLTCHMMSQFAILSSLLHHLLT